MTLDIILDSVVKEDLPRVQEILRDTQQKPAATTLYHGILQYFSEGKRNTPEQLRYLDVYEQALAVFRASALELRKAMDVRTLEQRLAVQKNALQALHHMRASVSSPLSSQDADSEEITELAREITDAVFFSNRYALSFAGNVGLALLGGKQSPVSTMIGLGKEYDASTDRDFLTGELTNMASSHLFQQSKEKHLRGEKPNDADIAYVLRGVFTSWINQFSWDTFRDIATKRNISEVTLRYGNCSLKHGMFKQKYDVVSVDDKFMDVRKEDVIGNQELGNVLWSSFMKLACYDHERRKNPFDPPNSLFIFGEPGCGKTFNVHASIRFFSEFCKEHGISFKGILHSTTDYASHYQNKTANALAELGREIRDFPGIVAMYVADADNIFPSRKDDMRIEQKQVQSVYFKMFDGSMIPRNGKFLPIFDANYVEGIDDATKSRIFARTVQMKRFEKPEQFAELLQRTLTKGLETSLLQESEWNELGVYLLSTPLSNREIDHVVKDLRGRLEVPQEMVHHTFEQKIEYRNAELKKILTLEEIRKAFDTYIATRMEIERASREAKLREDAERFALYLTIKNPGTLEQAAPTGA